MSKSKQFPVSKPTKGKLWYGDKLILQNKPFPILQHRKKELLALGFSKDKFKITY